MNKVLTITITALLVLLNSISGNTAGTMNSVALYLGMYPTMGGNLNSGFQENTLGINNGIDGINRFADGVENERIDKLTGLSIGSELTTHIYSLLSFKVGLNYSKSMAGGTGKSTDLSGNSLRVNYSMWVIDMPFLAGLSIPFGEKVRISLYSGLALVYGSFSTSFKSSTINHSATFNGWALPLCISLNGEYLVYKNIALVSSVSYFRGTSETITSNSDYASIDFSGYRWQVGALYYFTAITTKRL